MKLIKRIKRKASRLLFKRKIDFLVIGGMKCGTTSLWHYLGQHPEIIASKIKEPCFFSYNYIKGNYWYYKQFGQKTNKKQKYFDASPVYIHDERSAPLIHEYYPKAKIIAVLRDPIERTISHYNFYSNPKSRFAIKNKSDRLDKRTFEQAIADDIAKIEKRTFYRYCRNSLYANQLSWFLKYWALSDILIINQSDLLLKPKETMKDILTFISVSDPNYFDDFSINDEKVVGEKSLELNSINSFKKYNSLEYEHSLTEAQKKTLLEFFKNDVAEVKSTFGIDFEWMDKYQNLSC